MSPGALREIAPPLDACAELEALRRLVAPRISADGYTPTPLPAVCIYRFSRPTAFTKMPAFGVTLGVVLSGSKDIRVGGRALHVDPGRLVVLTRDMELESAARDATPARPYIGISLCFSPDAVARALVALSDAGAKTTKEEMPAFVAASDPRVLSALVRLVRAIDDPLERQVLAPLAIEEILLRLLRSDAAAAVRSAVGRAADAPRILAAMQHMRAECARPLSVESIARHVAMSPSHFAHRFRAVARVTPKRYLREVRLERARDLLAEPGARAGDVASRVGFKSPSHFTREFKRRYGAAPIEFVRRAR